MVATAYRDRKLSVSFIAFFRAPASDPGLDKNMTLAYGRCGLRDGYGCAVVPSGWGLSTRLRPAFENAD
jgi:hypothetical protein